MKLLVIQEQHFIEMPNGEVWVDSQSDANFWKRYLKVFDEIVVCARLKKQDVYKIDKLIRSDTNNVSFVGLPNTRGVKQLILNYRKTRKIMKEAMEQCDRIIFRAPSPISMVAYPLARKSGKPFACEIMNNPYTHYSPAAMQNVYQPLLRWLIVKQTKSLCNEANGVSYVTKKMLQELYPCRATTYGETKEYFEGSYSTINLNESMYSFEPWSDKKPKEITFIHTGKMEDNRKGQDIFIKTIYLLRKRGYNVSGILVGDGEKRNEFEKLAMELQVDSFLDFVGWVAGFENMKKQLQRAHFAVFPTLGEGLPRSVIEAMSQGLLCFGSKVDGMVELLNEDCLIERNDEVEFSNKIERYIEDWDKVLRERKIQYLKSKEYSAEILNDERTKFYEKLKDVK